ncbi:hypothetical protein COTS27_00149 [Spirochaetota bacterium]|nr:hypothetical protein COTS27_00149 [Spirochaetota bacterium]
MGLIKDMFEKLEKAGYSTPNLEKSSSSISYGEQTILKLSNSEYTLRFILNDDSLIPEKKLKKIVFPETFNIMDYLYFNEKKKYYFLNEFYLFSRIFTKGEYNSRYITEITIKKIGKKDFIRRTKKRDSETMKLYIKEYTFKDVMQEVYEIRNTRQAYSNSLVNHLTNDKAKKFGIKVGRRTSIEKGELKITLDRLNLKTKKKKDDLKKYLNNEDIKSAEVLFDKMKEHELFSPGYLVKLNEKFIKEKLQNIIKLGKDILDIKKSDINNPNSKLKNICSKLKINSVIKLENIWQKYFKDNLLYLIFTYKKIFEKIELKNEKGKGKILDFIGINHYKGVDVIEIKTHLARILTWDKSHDNYCFTSEMSKAIIQTKNYLDCITRARFVNPEDKEKITKFTGEENLYSPKGIIIISSEGREFNVGKNAGEDRKELGKRDLTKLRNSLKDIEIITFSEVISLAEEYIKNIKNSN